MSTSDLMTWMFSATFKAVVAVNKSQKAQNQQCVRVSLKFLSLSPMDFYRRHKSLGKKKKAHTSFQQTLRKLYIMHFLGTIFGGG